MADLCLRSCSDSMRVLDQLRAATREAHTAIERAPAFARLLAADLRIDEYVTTLRRLQAFHSVVEAGLQPPLQACVAAAALLDGERLRALEADLDWFGASRMPLPVLKLAPDSLAAALGILYVIEGSALGGRVIGRHVARTLRVRAGAGGSFYCGPVSGSGARRWKAFQELLVSEVDDAKLAWEPAAAAAQRTFSALDRWIRA